MSSTVASPGALTNRATGTGAGRLHPWSSQALRKALNTCSGSAGLGAHRARRHDVRRVDGEQSRGRRRSRPEPRHGRGARRRDRNRRLPPPERQRAAAATSGTTWRGSPRRSTSVPPSSSSSARSAPARKCRRLGPAARAPPGRRRTVGRRHRRWRRPAGRAGRPAAGPVGTKGWLVRVIPCEPRRRVQRSTCTSAVKLPAGHEAEDAQCTGHNSRQ